MIDLRGRHVRGHPVHRYRLIDESRQASAASGLWNPHDVHFSHDGKTMYVAAIESTFIVDVSRVLSGSGADDLGDPQHLRVPRRPHESAEHRNLPPGGRHARREDPRRLGRALGGVSNTSCNTDESGTIGGLHFWALAPIKGVAASRGASPSSPKKLGVYFNPNPGVNIDPLHAWIDAIRAERGCTVHVFRRQRQLLAGRGRARDRRRLHARSARARHGLVRGGRVIRRLRRRADRRRRHARGSAHHVGQHPRVERHAGRRHLVRKEYKSYIYAGDMLRGVDVYRFVD